MALGGGTFVTQNKILPGSYINFVSTANAGLVFGDRGACAAPLNLDWGSEGEVIEVTVEDFEKNSLKIFGYSYTDEEMKPYRDLFKNAQKCYFYRVTGGVKASATLGIAKCAGTRGNSIFYTVAKNADNEALYDVCTYIRSIDSSIEANKLYDFENTKAISPDIINVGGKASITQDNSDLSNPYYCAIDGVREGTDLNENGKPINRALCFAGITVPCKIKVTCANGSQNSVRVYSDGTAPSTLSPAIDGTTAVFTIPAGDDAARDVYVYGAAKIRMLKIEIVYEGAITDTLVDKQSVTSANKLNNNDFIIWESNAALVETAGTFLTNGTTTVATGATYQKFLSAIESTQFNTLVCDSTTDTIKALFVSFTKRLRDTVGVKFQTVVYKYAGDYEGLINLTTPAKENIPALVWWVAGAEANCAINKSCANKKYDGEYTPICTDTQAGLENAINNGELKFHKVGSDYRVLTDINSLVTTTSEKSNLFCSNQTIRVCDQIAMDIATIFNTRYLGIMPNDKTGRIALGADIVKYMKNLETLRAIEDFTDTDVVVEQGEVKRAVVVNTPITVVNCMEQLYMTVKVN
ncbi:MAG: phage tail sheath C-terminal domain-containing protein [Clostridia bacterium]|nr:phage tail sheath C-terminal domain-containing protein [Clostridia bacterium]